MPALIYRSGEINDYAVLDDDLDMTGQTPVAEIRDRDGGVLFTPDVTVTTTFPADFIIELPNNAERDRTLQRTRDPVLVILFEEAAGQPRSWATLDLQVET